MKAIPLLCLLFLSTFASLALGDAYTPTENVGEFLRQFERAYEEGDAVWLRSAVDKGGIIKEVNEFYFSLLLPKPDGEKIVGISAKAAPSDYEMPSSLLDFEIVPTIPVDFIVSFKRTRGGIETTIKVPVGYREGKVWLAGAKKKEATTTGESK